MQRNLTTVRQLSRRLCLSAFALAALTLSACGPIGGDSDDPTATVESISPPTSGSDTQSPSTPVAGGQSGLSIATPNPSQTTPVLVVPNDPPGVQATPNEPFTVVVGTPDVADSPDANAATPVAGAQNVPNTSFAGSDGTSGATPALESGSVADPSVPEDPAATPVAPSGPETSEAGATPEAVALADIPPVTVTDCAPASVPPLATSQVQYLTNADVNFRTGPGSDCDTIGTGPIGTNIPVTVVSGPVVREGEEFTWVQVQIVDDTGWIIVGVLDPAP
jgi:hypothetical protein